MAIKDRTRTKTRQDHLYSRHYYMDTDGYNRWCKELGVGRLYVEPTHYYTQQDWHPQRARPAGWFTRLLHWLIG